MTLKEISAGLINGFHDAALENISIDYAAATISIRFNVFLGLPVRDLAIRERYGKASLLVTGMQYCVIEKPEDNGHGLPSHFDSTVDDFETSSQPQTAAALPGLESSCFGHSFFVFGWNSCIHVAGQSAELIFDNPDDHSYNDEVLAQLRAES